MPPAPSRTRLRPLLCAVVVGLLTVGLLSGAATTTAARPKPGSSDSCGAKLAKPGGGNWRCTFADEFSGTSIDTGKWLVGETPTSGFHVGLSCFDDRNVSVGSGTLRLVAQDEGHDFHCASPYAPFDTRYTGGHVATSHRFSQTYGRFEVRARYPVTGPGIHAGFWLYPQRHTYGAWPASGEIDVAEWWSNEPTYALPSLHYPGRDGSLASADSGWGCRVADPTQYHAYAVEWQAHEMRFYIDGGLCFRRSWTPEAPLVAPQPFDHPFNIVLTNAVDHASGPNAPGSHTAFPATYEVDYVRAWQ